MRSANANWFALKFYAEMRLTFLNRFVSIMVERLFLNGHFYADLGECSRLGLIARNRRYFPFKLMFGACYSLIVSIEADDLLPADVFFILDTAWLHSLQ